MLKTRDEVALLCVCAVVILSPALILGFPAGHDGSFHARAWLAVAESWREGVVLPQWAQSFAYSFGEPVFTFYPPVSWALGGLMIVLVGYSFAAMAYSAVVLLTAGVAMRACAREALLGRYALLASCMYMGNPYMIISLYQRNAFSEALAGAIFPLVFMYAWRLRLQPLAALPLAICVGVIWLTSVPGALIMTYIVVILAALVCVVERRVSVLALATGALGAAVGLASIYLWPAFRQQDLVQLGMLTSAFFEPEKNFPVRWAMDPVSGLFPRLLCIVVAAQGAALIAVLLSIKPWRQIRDVSLAVGVVGAASLALMLPISGPLWACLPKMRFVQFPWRYLFVL